MRKVRVAIIAVWACPACGATQQIKPRELDEDEKEEAVRVMEGLEDWQEVDLSLADGYVAIPDDCQCAKCRAVFEVDDEDDEG